MTDALTLSGLSVQLRSRAVLRDVSLRIAPGEVVGLIGPNGAGKTTLMRAALGLVPAQGRSSLMQLSQAERARAVAWLPQAREVAWPVSVETLVGLGRLPHPAASPAANARAVQAALAEMQLTHMRDRTATRLSGGELARVLIARALAQEAPLVLADEPVAGLDPAHQIACMRSFARLAGQGRAVLVSLHDLGLAARFCTRLVMLTAGQIVADGPPDQVLTADLLCRHFHITAHIQHGPQGLIVQPLDNLDTGG